MSLCSPALCVVCDRCCIYQPFDLTPVAGGGWDDRNLEEDLRRAGWKTTGPEEHLCLDCQQSEDEADPGSPEDNLTDVEADAMTLEGGLRARGVEAMKIEARDGEVHIVLSPREAASIQVDHGEMELVIPVEDSMGALMDVSAALREVPLA